LAQRRVDLEKAADAIEELATNLTLTLADLTNAILILEFKI
jgi:hypothetical protein